MKANSAERNRYHFGLSCKPPLLVLLRIIRSASGTGILLAYKFVLYPFRIGEKILPTLQLQIYVLLD
jgi:hypothetical protein